METLITAVIFLLILSVLVLVHEAGHFWVAKKMGIKVEEFGLGLPPKIWGKKYGETEYTLNLLPIGGFVRMYGESPDGVSIQNGNQQAEDVNRSFMSKSKLARTAVLLAGVTANLLLGIIIFTIVFTVGLPKFAATPVIGDVVANSPAEQAGLEVGQTIVAFNGQPYDELAPSFSEAVQESAGEEVSITVETEEGVTEVLSVVPRQDPPAGEGALGIVISGGDLYVAETEQYPLHEAWWRGNYIFARDVGADFSCFGWHGGWLG